MSVNRLSRPCSPATCTTRWGATCWSWTATTRSGVSTPNGTVGGRLLSSSGYRPSIILYDLPGTVNAEGVIASLSSLDRLFVPIKADKVVMESTLSFARTLHLTLVQNGAVRLAGVHLFWTMIDRRERTPLYGQYEEVIRQLGLPLMRTHVPYRSKFNKELLADGTGVGRSTLLAPERSFAADAQLDALASEILSILNMTDNG